MPISKVRVSPKLIAKKLFLSDSCIFDFEVINAQLEGDCIVFTLAGLPFPDSEYCEAIITEQSAKIEFRKVE